MVVVREKTQVRMKLEGRAVSHARTDVRVRDVQTAIDEPLERGGTNQGLSPTETLMAALIGCTNVIGHKVAHKHGIALEAMDIRLEADFDRRGVTLQEEVAVPFPVVTMHIAVTTPASDAEIETLKRELAMFCPLSKVIRAAGTDLREVWTVTRP
jgi:uncharacterized OsmC-like protein